MLVSNFEKCWEFSARIACVSNNDCLWIRQNISCTSPKKRCGTIAKIIGPSRRRLKDRETISNVATILALSLFLLSAILAPRTPVSRISYRLSASQTKRAVRNWVSHLLPDMIDKSLPSVISAKLLFRRAAARAHHSSTSSYSSSNHRSTATCLFARSSCIRGVAGDKFLFSKN